MIETNKVSFINMCSNNEKSLSELTLLKVIFMVLNLTLRQD
jgi:hypothetical protein